MTEDSRKERAIDYFVEKLKSELAANTEKVARVVAKMGAGTPLAFHYEARWGHGVEENYESWWLGEMIERLGQLRRGELEGAKTIEALALHYVDALTEKAMRVEHSSNPFACAVSMAEQDVCRRLRETWKYFLIALADAERDDREREAEAAAGIVRSTIETQKRIINGGASPDDAKAARKKLAAMRAILKGHRLGETSHGHSPFWIASGDAGEAVLGLVSHDVHPIPAFREEAA